MAKICEFIKTDDWKTEKHVPVIELPPMCKAGEPFDVTVTVGKEIAHPNTTEHFIAWISLFFKPANGEVAYEMGTTTFSAHGASVKGPNTVTIHADSKAVFRVKLDQPGQLISTSWCNLHGLWEDSKEIKF